MLLYDEDLTKNRRHICIYIINIIVCRPRLLDFIHKNMSAYLKSKEVDLEGFGSFMFHENIPEYKVGKIQPKYTDKVRPAPSFFFIKVRGARCMKNGRDEEWSLPFQP